MNEEINNLHPLQKQGWIKNAQIVMAITKSRNNFIEMVGNLFLMLIEVKKIFSARIKKSIIYV